jgi:hypothetical protein
VEGPTGVGLREVPEEIKEKQEEHRKTEQSFEAAGAAG